MPDITNIIVNVMENASKTSHRDSRQILKAIHVGGAANDNFTFACISLTYATVET